MIERFGFRKLGLEILNSFIRKPDDRVHTNFSDKNKFKEYNSGIEALEKLLGYNQNEFDSIKKFLQNNNSFEKDHQQKNTLSQAENSNIDPQALNHDKNS